MSPFFVALNDIINLLKGYVWGSGLITVLILSGILLSVFTRLVQFRHLSDSFRYAFKNKASSKGISPFASLCTSLSSTVGTGNIVGVSSAIYIGGPGAVFWMVIAGILGMAIKYAEGFLAVKHKTYDNDGRAFGGPFYYIEKGLGKNFKFLAVMFSVFGALAGILGIGTLVQSNSIISAVDSISQKNMHIITITSIVLTLLSGIIIFGGIKRISAVSTVIVPIMSAAYIALCLFIIIRFKAHISDAIFLIVKTAFNPKSALGAAGGISLKTVVQQGFGRGMFSNESGLGSAPISAAAVDCDDPVKEGLVLMLGTFIDTVIICSITGLTVTVTAAYKYSSDGVKIAEHAFKTGLPFNSNISAALLDICLILFAFTTIIGWNFYSEKCLEYLFKSSRLKKTAVTIFRVFYIAAVFAGCYLSAKAVWSLADIFNGLMAIPNLIAVVLLGKSVATETKRYFDTQNVIKR